MLAAIHEAYIAAGRPGLRQISQGLRLDDSAPATLNYQAVGKILNGRLMPNLRQLISLASWLFREGAVDGRLRGEAHTEFIERINLLGQAALEEQHPSSNIGESAGSRRTNKAGDFDESESTAQVADEEMLLGCAILSADAMFDTSEIVKAEDFTDEFNEGVYRSLISLQETGRTASPDSVLEALDPAPLDGVNAEYRLARIIAKAPDPRTIEIYAERIVERSLARKLAKIGERMSDLAGSVAGSTHPDTDTLIQFVEDEFFAAVTARDSAFQASGAIESTLDFLEAAGSSQGTLLGLPSGFRDLDRLNAGFRPGEFVVVAGASRMGKTTLGLNFVRTCSIAHSHPSFLVSLQTSHDEIMMRLMSAEARVALHHMRSGSMNDDDWTRLARVVPTLGDAPMFIVDDANYTTVDLVRNCRRLSITKGIRLVVIDSLDLLFPVHELSPEDFDRSLATVARALRKLAKEHNLAVIAFYQMGRITPERRSDHHPQVSDIPWVLESAADVVMLLHREDAYELESPRAGEADFIVAKNSNGPTGVITTAFQGHYARFVDMSAI
ncbi:replicative DNA helicase [Streptomyces microflavus]|uniref:replicative DNA helicase n=1 Tax=Streptomyces microflavus TaxID=1919 RepID=UPI00379CD4CD